MLGCAARPGNLGVHRAVRGGSGSSETLERCRIPSVNSGRLTASKTTLGYFRESGAQGEGPRVRIRLPPPGSHEQIEPSGELTTGRKQTYLTGEGLTVRIAFPPAASLARALSLERDRRFESRSLRCRVIQTRSSRPGVPLRDLRDRQKDRSTVAPASISEPPHVFLTVLRAETFCPLSSLLQLLCDLAQLALRLRTETAQSTRQTGTVWGQPFGAIIRLDK